MRTSTIIETDSLQAKKMQASPSQGLDTQAFVRMIVERASTPFERLEPEFEQGQTTDAMSMATYMEYWARTLSSDGNRDRLKRFFEFQDLDQTDIQQMLSPAKLRADAKLPEWALTLAEVIDTDFKPEILNSPIDPKEPITFEDILIPFAKVFRRRLKSATGTAYKELALTTHLDVERFLIRKIISSIAPCLFPQFQQHISRSLGEMGLPGKSKDLADDHYYQLFIQELKGDNLRRFYLAFPVIARIISNLLHQHIVAFTNFLLRLQQDRQALIQHFCLDKNPGKISHINLGVSDPHKGGEGVLILTFESGWKLIYKPRTMEMGLAYNKLCEWFNKHLNPQIKILNILPGDEYGWIEFAPNDACINEAAVERYYQRAGILLGITYLLDSTDFHAENVIACGEHPLLIDHETFLQPQFKTHHAQLSKEKRKKLDTHVTSVLRPGLLPANWNITQIPNDSMSGLGSISDIKNEVPSMHCINRNTDRMAIESTTYAHEVTTNLPRIGDTFQRIPAYQKAFESGFQQLYDLLIQERELLLSKESPLRHFENMNVRFLFRMTQVYATILQKLIEPTYAKDAVYYGLRLELLSRAFLAKETPPPFWAVLAAERKAMLNRDVPFFEFNSSSNYLPISETVHVESYFHSSCMDYVKEKLKNFGPEDYNNQLAIIQQSIQGEFSQK